MGSGISKDTLFLDRSSDQSFVFDQAIATVFDDMIDRSVPFYRELQRFILHVCKNYAQEHSCVYDLGTATGTSIAAIATELNHPNIRLIGLDNSEAMLEKARQKCHNLNTKSPIHFETCDLEVGVTLQSSSVVLLVLTLQFIRPENRSKILRSVYESLLPGGVLILVEKVIGETPELDRYWIEQYYQYKRDRGYSDLEISKKREALENVLVPLKLSENLSIVRSSGFQNTDLFFKWLNFSGILAIKL